MEKAKHTCFPKAGAKLLLFHNIHKYYRKKIADFCRKRRGTREKRLVIRRKDMRMAEKNNEDSGQRKGKSEAEDGKIRANRGQKEGAAGAGDGETGGRR